MIATRPSLQMALLLVAVVSSVAAFSPLSATQSTRLAQRSPLNLLSPKAVSIQSPSTRQHASMPAYRSPLFQQSRQRSHHSHDINPLQRRVQSLLQNLQIRAWWAALLQAQAKFRRATVILAASAMIWMGTSAVTTQPASASSIASASSTVLERLLPSGNADKIIDNYVRNHMFDDDDAALQDPLESAYREAHEDYNTKGAYPKAIKDITAEVMGSSGVAKTDDGEGSMGVIGILTSALRIMEKRGLSETTALVIIAGTLVVAFPSFLLFGGMIVGGISKRNMNKLMKTRYGETYT